MSYSGSSRKSNALGFITVILLGIVVVGVAIIGLRVFNAPAVIINVNEEALLELITLRLGNVTDNKPCNNCLKNIVNNRFDRLDGSVNDLSTDVADLSSSSSSSLNSITNVLDQFLVFSRGASGGCSPTDGLYNVSSYFPAIRAEYDSIVFFDNVRGPIDTCNPACDPARTRIIYFPALPQPFPVGSGAGINVPALNGTNVLDHVRFKKFQSVPFSIGFFLNLSFSTTSPTDERLTVFLKNVEDRGPDNLEHRRYMAALTKSKVVGRYENRIKKFVADLYNSWVITKAPILSSHKDRLIDFFLDIHLGTAFHPAFVKSYFDDFLVFISVTNASGLPATAADPISAERIMKGHMNTECVREYFRTRIAVLAAGGLTDTITWHWIQSGMPRETVLIEAIHNIVAFSQYDNTIQLLVTQANNPALTPGTGGQSFLALFRAAGAGQPISFAFPPPFVNLTRYSGTPEVLQLNVVREFMRIMLPNNLWFSKDNATDCTSNCPAHTQARHIPQIIQIRAEYEKAGSPGQWFPAGSPGWNVGVSRYATYDPSRYVDFPGKFSDAIVEGNATFPAFDYNDTSSGLLCIVAGFDHHPLDNETQIPRGDASMIPVFQQPIYAAFGLGARRCPAEIFNQRIILELFRAIQCLSFYDDCAVSRFPQRCNLTSPDFLYPQIPLAPFKAAPDSLFVVPNSATCPYPAPCA